MYAQGQHPEYPGQSSVDALGTVERYFSELVSVPRPEERLSVMIYMRTFGPGAQQVRLTCVSPYVAHDRGPCL